MVLTAPPPIVDEDRAPVDAKIRLHQIDTTDLWWMGASALSAFCLNWLLYERLTPLSGGLGFWSCWYLAFLAVYWLTVRDQRGPMAARDRVARVVVSSTGILLIAVLALIIGYTVFRGVPALRPHFFTQTQEHVGPLSPAADGGAAHSIVGTLEQVGLAMLISVPLAFGTAVFLNEVGGRLARPVRLIVDAMSAVPSILAGLFIYAMWVLELGQGQSGLAAALALSVLMLPTVTRTAEVVLRLVPGGLREGALALGGSEWRMTKLVVLPTARSGLVTAVILGIARCVGETAPLLLTAGGEFKMVWNPIGHAQDALPLFVFRLIRQPQQSQIDRAWTGALVLLLIVLVLFAVARFIGGRAPGQKRRRSRRSRSSRSLAPTEGAA
jgi:phosphate transport system permease protein